MRRAWLLAYAASAALVVLFHVRLAWPGRALVSNDFRALFIPLRAGLQNTVAAGELPVWQRGMFLGYPVLGDIQFQIFNPLTWLTLPLDPARGVTVQSLAELCLCAAGMAFWMRQRGLRPVDGVLAGAVFALSLKQTVHLHHWTFAASTCAWPWMFAGIDGFVRAGQTRFIVLTAFATCATWIGGSPQMAYFGTGVALAYALAMVRDRRGLAPVVAVLLGVALAAPLLLPVAELSALGPRGVGVTYSFQSSWSWPDRSVWIAMVLPRCWGGRPSYSGPMNYWEVQGYLGLLAMALLAAVPWRKRGLALFAILAAFCLWFSFGDNAWLGLHQAAVRFLPGYGGFRNPTRAMMLAIFCVALLAAEGLFRIHEDARARRNVLIAIGVLAVLVGAAAAFPRGYRVEELRADAVAAAVLLAAAAWWLVVRPRWAALAILLSVADVAVQTWDSPEIGEAALEGHALEGLAPAVPAPPAPRRVAVLLPWGEANDATYARGWEGVTGYGPTPILRVLNLIDATRSGVPGLSQPLMMDPNFPRLRPESNLVPLFSAPLLATNQERDTPVLARDGRAGLYRLPALPRVFWTGAWRAAPDGNVGHLLPGAAAGRFAILPEAPSWTSGEEGSVPAFEIEVHTRSLAATVEAPRDGLAVVLDPWFPGWSATVDGRPATILRADYAFVAVPLAKGLHRIELTYFPTRLLPGILVAMVAAALLSGGSFLLRKRDGAPR